MNPNPLAWQADALCAEYDRDLWFPVRGQPTEPAKAVCRDCLVREECLEYAVTADIGHGVWGGRSAEERRVLVKTRRGPQANPGATLTPAEPFSRPSLPAAG